MKRSEILPVFWSIVFIIFTLVVSTSEVLTPNGFEYFVFFKQNSCNALAKEEITKSLKFLTHLSFIGTPLAPPIKAPRCPVGYLRRHYSNCLELS